MKAEVLIKQIADRLKEQRKSKGWSLDATAKQTGVSKAMLGQIERGESSPTIGTLWKIASGLEVSFSSFFTLPPKVESAAPMHQKDHFPNDPDMHVRPLFPFTAETGMETLEITLTDYHQQDSSPHQTGVIEHVIVTEGQLRLYYDGEWRDLVSGDTARFYADQPHSYCAKSNIARFHNIICYPAGTE